MRSATGARSTSASPGATTFRTLLPPCPSSWSSATGWTKPGKAPPASAGSPASTSASRRCPGWRRPAAPCWSRLHGSCALSGSPRRSPPAGLPLRRTAPPAPRPTCQGRTTMLRAMGASIVAMVLMLVIGPPFIRWLRLNEFGQNIREEGPEGHKTKEGTPTMGGVLIWFAVLVPFIIFSRFSVASITVMIATLGNAAIGFADDWIKIVRKRSLGLAARYKLLLQLLLALFVAFIALHFVGLDTRVA